MYNMPQNASAQNMQHLVKKTNSSINTFTNTMKAKFGFKLTRATQWGVTVTKGEAFLNFKNTGVVITQFTINADGSGLGIQFNMWGQYPNGQQVPMLACNNVEQLPNVITWLEDKVVR